MGLIKSTFKVSILILMMLLFILCSYKVYAEQGLDDKCYKTNTQIMPWLPKGLEVDSQGNIYLGLAGGINVYDASGTYKYSIKVKTCGVFEMKINNNGMINVALVRERKVRIYNKEGYITQESEDYNNEAYYKYKKNNRSKIDSQGSKYKLSNFLGYTKVVKTTVYGVKNTVYKIPLLIWILKLLIPTFIIFLLIIGILVYAVLKKYSK